MINATMVQNDVIMGWFIKSMNMVMGAQNEYVIMHRESLSRPTVAIHGNCTSILNYDQIIQGHPDDLHACHLQVLFAPELLECSKPCMQGRPQIVCYFKISHTAFNM